MKTVSAALLPMITIDRRARRPPHQQVYDALALPSVWR
jgi:hypothetical protein